MSLGDSSESQQIFIFLTHDVDWPLQGPGKDHILARRERFSEEIIAKVLKEGYNPYYNIPEIMDLETSYGLKSTFFFRPVYDDGTEIDCYSEIMKELWRKGWEIGVHLNRADNLNEIKEEKQQIEKVIGTGVIGARVHYLRVKFEDLPLLREAGFTYDSSLSFSKKEVTSENMGFLKISGLIEFPITLMDAYMFTYMRIREEDVLDVIRKALRISLQSRKSIITILWHDSSLKMKGGRKYKDVVEYIASLDWISAVRGADLVKLIEKGEV